MKFLKIIFIAFFFFTLGYIVGNLFPFPLFPTTESISGETELKIAVLRDDKTPIPKISVNSIF